MPLDTVGSKTGIPAALIMHSDVAKVTSTSEFCTDLVGLQNQSSCFKTTPTKPEVKKNVRSELNKVTEKCSTNSTQRGEGSKNNLSDVMKDIFTLLQFGNSQVQSYGKFGVEDKNEVTSKKNEETVPSGTHVNLGNRENKGLQNQSSCFKTTPTKPEVKKNFGRKLNIITEKRSTNSTQREKGSKNNRSGVMRDSSTFYQLFRNSPISYYRRFGVEDKNKVTSIENDYSVKNDNSVKSYLYSNLDSDKKFNLFLQSIPRPNRFRIKPLSDDSGNDTSKKKQDPDQLDPNTGHRKNKFMQAVKRKTVSEADGPMYIKKAKDQYEIKNHENKHYSNVINVTNIKDNRPKNARKIEKQNFSRKHSNISDTTNYVQDDGVIEGDSSTEMQDNVTKSGFSGYSSMLLDSPNQRKLKNELKMSTVQNTSPSTSSQFGVVCPLCYKMFPSDVNEVHYANCPWRV